MTITLKLFASLAAHLPPDARTSHQVQLELEPGATVIDVIHSQRIPESICAIVLVDGNWVGRPERGSRELRDGEVIAIWPPVAGGAPAFTRSVEMGVSREEFLRLLRAAVPQFEMDGHVAEVASGSSRTDDAASGAGRTMITWIDGARRGTIALVRTPDRELSAGLVPRHRVEITLEGCSEADGETFMARFQRAFLRGGG